MPLSPRQIERNDLREWSRYLHELGLEASTIKKTSLGYHAQIRTDQYNTANFSSADGPHVMLSFTDLQNRSIVGSFLFDVTETGRVYGEQETKD